MEIGRPSRTALAAARHRAAHQMLEGGRIFTDPLALAIVGGDPREIAKDAAADTSRRAMRMFIAVRTRFAEDALGAAIQGGVRQLVVLGAGLDTFGYRSPYREKLRVFEVDHPATQNWKRSRLAEAGIPIPDWLTFAPVDFERQTLADGLGAARFDADAATFFTWLGVVPYLTEAAIFATLQFIGRLRGGGQVVFDYGDPPETLAPEVREYYQKRAAHVDALNEPWVSSFDPPKLHAKLRELGFEEIEDLGPREIRVRYFPGATGPVRDRGGHILRASSTKATADPA